MSGNSITFTLFLFTHSLTLNFEWKGSGNPVRSEEKVGGNFFIEKVTSCRTRVFSLFTWSEKISLDQEVFAHDPTEAAQKMNDDVLFRVHLNLKERIRLFVVCYWIGLRRNLKCSVHHCTRSNPHHSVTSREMETRRWGRKCAVALWSIQDSAFRIFLPFIQFERNWGASCIFTAPLLYSTNAVAIL